MMRCLLAKIDLQRLGLRLWMTSGRALGEWELKQWLDQAGLKWSCGAWYTAGRGLDALKADEVLEKQVLETRDGITFVDREIGEPPNPY